MQFSNSSIKKMADISANTISIEANEETKKENDKTTDQQQNQNTNPNTNPNPNPSDMRICITGGAGGGFLLAASARMAGALAPKSHSPKADIF